MRHVAVDPPESGHGVEVARPHSPGMLVRVEYAAESIGIRFHHRYVFWHRLEAQKSGFHFKTGDPKSDAYSDIQAGTVTSSQLRIGSTTIGEAELSLLKKLVDKNQVFDLYNVEHDEFAYAGQTRNDAGRLYVLTAGEKNSGGRWKISFR